MLSANCQVEITSSKLFPIRNAKLSKPFFVSFSNRCKKKFLLDAVD